MKITILVIEDEEAINDVISMSLRATGYETVSFLDGDDASVSLENRHDYDCAVVDVMLPGKDGFELLPELLKYEIPVIFLTAKGELQNKVKGLTKGAEDYMVKPFLPKELLFRVNAILRRSYKAENPLVKLHGSKIDFERAEVLKNGEHISLTAKEHDILAALCRNAGRIVTIDALCEAAWGDNPYGYENSLMAHIRRIREKIESNPSQPVSLITIKGLGYKLVTEGK